MVGGRRAPAAASSIEPVAANSQDGKRRTTEREGGRCDSRGECCGGLGRPRLHFGAKQYHGNRPTDMSNIEITLAGERVRDQQRATREIKPLRRRDHSNSSRAPVVQTVGQAVCRRNHRSSSLSVGCQAQLQYGLGKAAPELARHERKAQQSIQKQVQKLPRDGKDGFAPVEKPDKVLFVFCSRI